MQGQEESRILQGLDLNCRFRLLPPRVQRVSRESMGAMLLLVAC